MTSTFSTPDPQLKDELTPDGAFVRQEYSIRDRITADGRSGFKAESGRYHLYVSLACPWAHRSIIARRVLELENIVSLSVVDPVRDERGWAFREGPATAPTRSTASLTYPKRIWRLTQITAADIPFPVCGIARRGGW